VNSMAYIIYLLLTYLITVHVGMRFYKNGRLYILTLMKGDEATTDSINRILLIGYYLLNLGYAALMISNWETVTTYADMVRTITTMTGRIVLTLAVVHYMNMFVIYLAGRKNKSLTHHKNY